jgi:Ca2+-binding EF-hand superfamily protein
VLFGDSVCPEFRAGAKAQLKERKRKMRGKFSWTFLACGVTVFTFLIPLSGQAQMTKSADVRAFSDKGEAQLKKSFGIFDTNKDGVIDRTEFRLQTGQMFFVSDKNRDSHLTPDELPNTGPKVFAEVDTNGDGKLTVNEFGDSRLMKFETYDLNKDNKITLDEVRAVIKKQR